MTPIEISRQPRQQLDLGRRQHAEQFASGEMVPKTSHLRLYGGANNEDPESWKEWWRKAHETSLATSTTGPIPNVGVYGSNDAAVVLGISEEIVRAALQIVGENPNHVHPNDTVSNPLCPACLDINNYTFQTKASTAYAHNQEVVLLKEQRKKLKEAGKTEEAKKMKVPRMKKVIAQCRNSGAHCTKNSGGTCETSGGPCCDPTYRNNIRDKFGVCHCVYCMSTCDAKYEMGTQSKIFLQQVQKFVKKRMARFSSEQAHSAIGTCPSIHRCWYWCTCVLSVL